MSNYIDVHSRVGEGRPFESRTVDDALREMDETGIEQAWICPTDVYTAVLNSEGNNFIAKTVASHSNRFVGCAVANPWFGKKALIELRAAFEKGLRVLYLCPPVQGFQLSDIIVDSLIEVAIEFNAPVYAHTGTPVCSEPFQLAALARRNPKAKFIMGHMGYADFWYDATPAAKANENIWIETSFINADVLKDGIAKIGVSRFLFGTSAPLSGVRPEIQKILDLGLSTESTKMILYHNALKVLL
jgi:uncharacterized protein